MALHARCLKVAAFKIFLIGVAVPFLFECVGRYAGNAVEGCACQGLCYIFPCKISKISQIYNKAIRLFQVGILFF